MNLNLASKWQGIVGKLGAFGAFVPTIADSVGVEVSPADAAKAIARADEAIEASDALKEAAILTKEALAPDPDGKIRITISEAGQGFLALEEVADEFEDIGTGVDEDDVPG